MRAEGQSQNQSLAVPYLAYENSSTSPFYAGLARLAEENSTEFGLGLAPVITSIRY